MDNKLIFKTKVKVVTMNAIRRNETPESLIRFHIGKILRGRILPAIRLFFLAEGENGEGLIAD